MRSAQARSARQAPVTRGTLLRLGLYWGTIVVLAVGSCTLTFWLLASNSNLFNIGAQELFFVRAVGLIALALGAAGIFFIVGALRRVTVPTRDMMESAERIAHGDYSARVREQGPRELRSLARSFNHMAEQLNNNESERRTLIANIANELRTPLTMLKENIEGLLDGNFARDDAHMNMILGETIRLSNLVEEMRMLALAESSGLILQRELTDLNTLVQETVELYHRDASDHNIGLHAVVSETPLIAMVDPARIQQAIGNLIEHALNAPLKSDIRVEVSEANTLPDDPTDLAQIEIAYRAAVIAPDQIANYFDRFYQQTPRENEDESGLGLAIAKLLVQAHGGDISISSDARRGTQFRFTLPIEYIE
ncbi:MAG TPA: HAMP domain-containing sensor histidine kinase [Anaerolineae bacterium]|nr:HAMP domain-containing sensor histidine kinase [Anaerolineae bacterium]